MNSDDDIVTRLRKFVRGCNHDWNLGNEWYPAPTECVSCARQRDAADEIERLRKALALAVGELSTYAPYGDRSPENLFEFFKEARRG